MAYIQPYFTPTENTSSPWFANVWNGFLKRREAENFRAMDRFLKSQDLDYLDAQIKISNENLQKFYELRNEMYKKDIEFVQHMAGEFLEMKQKAAEDNRLRDLAQEKNLVEVLTTRMNVTPEMVVRLDQRRNQVEGYLNRSPELVQQTALQLMGNGAVGQYLRNPVGGDSERALVARNNLIDPIIEEVYGPNMNSAKLMTENPATYNMVVNSILSHVERFVADNRNDPFNTTVIQKAQSTNAIVNPDQNNSAYKKNLLALANSIDVDIRGKKSRKIRTVTFSTPAGSRRVDIDGRNVFLQVQVDEKGNREDVLYYHPTKTLDKHTKFAGEWSELDKDIVRVPNYKAGIDELEIPAKIGSAKAADRFKSAMNAIQVHDSGAQAELRAKALGQLSTHQRLGRLKRTIWLHQKQHPKSPGAKIKFEGKEVDLSDLKSMKRDVSGRLYGASLNPYKDQQMLIMMQQASPLMNEVFKGNTGKDVHHMMQGQLQDDIADMRENIANLNIRRMIERKRIASGNLYQPFKRNFLLENPWKIKSPAEKKGILVATELKKIKQAPKTGDEVPDMPNVVYNQAYQTPSGFAIGVDKKKGAFIYDPNQTKFTYVNAKEDPQAFKQVTQGLRHQSKNPVLKPMFDLKKLSEASEE